MATGTPTTAFRLLGVSPDADTATVRAAWRALARRYHPDQVRGDRAEANRRLAELNAAHDLVMSWVPRANTTDAAKSHDRKEPRHKHPPTAVAASVPQRMTEIKQRAVSTRNAEAHRDALARARFLDTLRALEPRPPTRTLGFA